MSVLELSRVSKFYGSVRAVEDVDLVVPTGGRAAIVGPSGSGKTTLLRLIVGSSSRAQAAFCLTSKWSRTRPEACRRTCAASDMCRRTAGCFRIFSVADNIGFGVGTRSAQRSKRVAELMEMVALDPAIGSRAPHELSGGQQQRVALARALSQRPRLMLLDEPFSALDTGLRAATRQAIGNLLTQVGATTILVTHDQVEALSFSDQIAVIRDGRMAQVGSGTELYLRPKDDLTARFLGEAVLLSAQLAGGVADCALGRIAVDDLAYEGHARVLLRPEQVQISPADSGDSGGARWQVERVDFEGFSCLITIRATGTTFAGGPALLTVRGLSTQAPQRGAKVKVAIIGRAHRMPS
jgi:iron(III) transport system ATP-binding protein